MCLEGVTMRCLFVCLLMCISLPLGASARPVPAESLSPGGEARLVGGPIGPAAKAEVDTLILMGPHGSGAPAIGSFESPAGSADWNGWTSIDYTTDNDPLWHVSTFHAVNGTFSAWCGDAGLPSCGQAWDEVGGYPNNSADYLEWRGAVIDNSQPCTVTVSAIVNLDTEPGYDYAYISCEKSGGATVDLWSASGQLTASPAGGTTVYTPGEYLGPAGDEVRVLFRFHSDGGFGGNDCLFPNDGAIQLDDVVITLDNGRGASCDFEDGTLGALAVFLPPGVGDYAKLWAGLGDLDPCRNNTTPQMAFIDDGVVVPGTGGSTCISWCYGPSGYVVNSTGGTSEALFPYWTGQQATKLHNAVISPPLAWTDPAHDGARLSFDVYRHEDLTGDAPGVFYTWKVRSVASGNPADLARASWRDRSVVSYGGPQYLRETHDLDDLLVPGRTHVQVRLAAIEYGWVWGWEGNDATPAPYFDNVRVATYAAGGPSLSVEIGNLAADAFPGSGEVDLMDLGANSVPFKASLAVDPPSTPSDALQITCKPLGTGAVLDGPPQLHYLLRRNPLFDPWRTAGLPDQGSVACTPIDAARWLYDLPDTGFLFPGDRLHYFFTASQTIGGTTETVILPADTTGFASFADYPVYNGGYAQAFSVRALPTIREEVGQPGVHVAHPILFWHDSGTDADWDVWTRVLHETTLLWQGVVDVFHTQGAASRLRNGLGARASVAQLAGYECMIYTSGEMAAGTIDGGNSSGIPYSPDAVRLDAWLRLGDRRLLAFGNDLASDLAAGVPERAALLTEWFACTVDARDVGPLIDGQTSPRVLIEAGNPVLSSIDSWVAYGGGCSSAPLAEGYGHLVRDRFDAVTTGPGSLRLAAWAAPGGGAGAYPYAAALATEVPVFGSRAILVPMDLALIRTDPDEGLKNPAELPARTRLILDALAWFGFPDNGIDVLPVPEAAVFAATARPNPFNPAVTITYTAPRPDHLTVRVYDLRGRLVRTLADRPVDADGTVAWDGTGADGAAAASGVYFYEVRLGDEVRIGKMALVK